MTMSHVGHELLCAIKMKSTNHTVIAKKVQYVLFTGTGLPVASANKFKQLGSKRLGPDELKILLVDHVLRGRQVEGRHVLEMA